MTIAPLPSTVVALALIPVAFLFVHAFLTGRRKSRFHPLTGALAVGWDLSVSIGYMMFRTFGGAVNGETLQMTPAFNLYFMVVHVPIAVVVMSLEFCVLGIGLWQLRMKESSRWHRRLTTPLFCIWWFAFLSGEILYIILYMV